MATSVSHASPSRNLRVLKNSTSSSVQTPEWRQQLPIRLKEGALIALGALCLYLSMALLTYDSADPAWDHSVQVERISNAGGSLGAWLSSVMFVALGYFAYLFPVLLAIKTWRVFRVRHQPWHWSGWLFSWRAIGLVFFVLSGAALAYIHFESAPGLPASAGGALGESLGQLAIGFLNVQGSTLLFLALFLFGFTVFTDLSWFRVLDVTGKITLDLLELIQGSLSNWWNSRQQARPAKVRLERDYDSDLQLDEPVFTEPPRRSIRKEPVIAAAAPATRPSKPAAAKVVDAPEKRMV